MNHTFILREITGLRNAGFDIHTISIRRPDRPVTGMSANEADEARRTETLLAIPALKILAILSLELLRRPSGFFRGLATALRAGGGAPKSVLLFLAYFAEAVVAGHLFLRARVDHFHTHFASTVGWLITRIFPLTMSITLHGSAEFVEPGAFHLREKIGAALFVVGISHFGVSQMMLATSYRDWPKIELVRLGVDLSAYSYRRKQKRDGYFRILTVGRLAEAKGLPLLLEAVAELISRGIKLRLDIVGHGPLRPILIQQAAELGIADAIAFHGMQPADAVREFYRAADVCVLASFLEGIPVVLMEAMALGTPVIATRVTGCPELIDDGRNGLLCTPGDVWSLVEALELIARTPELSDGFSLAARSTIETRYNLATNIEALANVFRKRLGAASSGALRLHDQPLTLAPATTAGSIAGGYRTGSVQSRSGATQTIRSQG